MNKKQLILDYSLAFLLSLIVLLASFFSTKTVASQEAKNNLSYYGEQISLTYRGEIDKEATLASFSKIHSLRVSIFDREANLVLEINPLDKEAASEDRKEELESHANSYYEKKSLTLGYPVLYYVKKTLSHYIRVGFPRSEVERNANAVLLYGSIALIVVDAAYFGYRYGAYSKTLKRIQGDIHQLEALSNENASSHSSDSLLALDESIHDVATNLEDKIDSLRKESLKVDYILDSMEEGLIVLDHEGKVTLINKYALRTLFLKKEDVYNKPYPYLLLGDAFNDKRNEALVKGEASFDWERKGKIYECCLSKIPLDWLGPSQKEGIGVLILDVTEQKRSEKLKRNFFQNASHELKTPLTAIIGYSELLSRHMITSEEEQQKALETIWSESKRMKKVLNDMLSLSSLESNVKERKAEWIDGKNAILEIVSSLSILAKEKNVKIELDLEPMQIEMAKEDFDQLIRNIIANAIFYNKDGGKVKITLNPILFRCEDTGIGIEEKYQTRVFERFFRVDKGRSRKDGGTGLGLAIVKHVCLHYGFELHLESRLQEGSTFTILFHPDK